MHTRTRELRRRLKLERSISSLKSSLKATLGNIEKRLNRLEPPPAHMGGGGIQNGLGTRANLGVWLETPLGGKATKCHGSLWSLESMWKLRLLTPTRWRGRAFARFSNHIVSVGRTLVRGLCPYVHHHEERALSNESGLGFGSPYPSDIRGFSASHFDDGFESEDGSYSEYSE
jgi:hypothetical protein